MSSQPPSAPHSPVPAAADAPTGSGVRRHHTISSASRSARAANKAAITEDPEPQQPWDDDEIVGEEWVGGVGAVGEKSSLHRQSSLPARYNRGLRKNAGAPPATMTPTSKTMNSLAAITAEHGLEGDEGDWENEMHDWNVADEVIASPATGLAPVPQSPNSPTFANPSPGPPAGSNIRRHQSLNYAENPPTRRPLRRSGTTAGKSGRPSADEKAAAAAASAANEEEDTQEEVYDYEEPIQGSGLAQSQSFQSTFGAGPTSPISGRTAWNANQGQEWRYGEEWRNQNQGVDDISRAMASLEMPSQQQQQHQHQHQQANNGRYNPGSRGGGPQSSSRKLQLVTQDLVTPNSIQQNLQQGPVSASAYVPHIGMQYNHRPSNMHNNNDRALTASGIVWDQKDRILGSRASGGNLHQNYQTNFNNIPPPPAIPSQYLNQVHHSGRLNINTSFNGQPPMVQPQMPPGNGQLQSPSGYLSSPVDVPSMIVSKGYNPATFDCKPTFARYFVIKSYTEDDVHKSLKYEIWSSTDPGNKRLDKAFKECAGRGPIYLFFSVNASGHFCGMAEMLTPVDYTRSSTVWASDKWKGVFKVRWIFVRDVPNATLRHIRLNNTQERKPVTNSRDTQELMPDAGHEMLRIFFSHPARTSLLQDFAFYEASHNFLILQSIQKTAQSGASPTPSHGQKLQQQQQQAPQQHPYAMPNPAGGYNPGQHMQMSPIAQMQSTPGQLGAHFVTGLHRNPSPGPSPNATQGFVNVGSGGPGPNGGGF